MMRNFKRPLPLRQRAYGKFLTEMYVCNKEIEQALYSETLATLLI